MIRTLATLAAVMAAGAALADGPRDGAARAERMFDALDADGDGRITRAEAEARRLHGLDPAGAPYDRAAFVAAAEARAAERAERAFERLDADHDGRLDAAELSDRRGHRTDRMFERLDANRDGVIDRGEAEAFGARGWRRGEGRG